MEDLILKKGEERRIKAGHLWVFSNEIDPRESPLKQFEPGQVVNIVDFRGQTLGSAYVNPATLIAARLISRKKNTPLDHQLLRERLRSALELRENLFEHPYYRLVHAEGDFLPGLVIDRYNNDFAVQITTAGMEGVKNTFCEVMEDLFPNLNLVFRNDTSSRVLEKLDSEITTYSSLTASKLAPFFQLRENDLLFEVPSLEGQKTGWFYDQRRNRRFAAELTAKLNRPKVLDAFCYAGGFGVGCANAGASEVTFIDSSATALGLVAANIELNNLGQNITTDYLQQDCITAMETLKKSGRKFDLVCLDPPAFIKRKKDEEAGLTAYYKANELALDLLEPGGFLITSSCSQHLERDALRRILSGISGRNHFPIQIIGEGQQGPDHPVHPAMPETNYLKTFFVRKGIGL